MNERLAAIWERHLPSTRDSCLKLQEGVSNWEDPTLREVGLLHAHRLAGSLGSFGFLEAGKICFELEVELRDGSAAKARKLVARLADLLPLEEAEKLLVAPPATVHWKRSVLVIDDDTAWTDQLSRCGQTRHIEIVGSATGAGGLELLQQQKFSAIILDLCLEQEDGLAVLARISVEYPETPVIVVSGSADLPDRVQVARLGGRGFLEKPIPEGEILDEAIRHIERLEQQRFHVVLVDDDPTMEDVLSECLDFREVVLTCTTTGRDFWEILEARGADLVVLDLELPDIHGLELLATMRNEARYVNTPVLVVTARNDRETVEAAFDGGADDFVGKPLILSEVRARVRNRLERSRLMRELAERDPLTGLTNRRRASQVIGQFLQLARRQKQPMALVLLDIDHFKRINDSFGHAIGDQVLRRLGEEMRSSFRSEDILVRWGGEEFLLAMYGVGLSDAIFRMAEFLESIRQLDIFAGQAAPVTFSAGVAEFTVYSDSLEKLYQTADQALYQAKADGRNRVMGPGAKPKVWLGPELMDQIAFVKMRGFVVEDDPEQAQLAYSDREQLQREIRQSDPRRVKG